MARFVFLGYDFQIFQKTGPEKKVLVVAPYGPFSKAYSNRYKIDTPIWGPVLCPAVQAGRAPNHGQKFDPGLSGPSGPLLYFFQVFVRNPALGPLP